MLYLTPAITIYLLSVACVLGLVFGSFCNAWAWRSCHEESIVEGRSHCAGCGHPLGALDLIPLVSWLALRGKCRYCQAPISLRYPAAELICAVYFVSVLCCWDVSFDTLRYWAVGCVLLTLSLVDWETMLIPDKFLVMLGGLALLRLPTEGFIGLLEGLLGAGAVAVPLLLIVLLADRIMGKETMGGGDLKLVAVLGLHFDAPLTLFLLFISCIIGIIFAIISGSMQKAFPFGPSLALAAWVVILCGEQVLAWYWQLCMGGFL